MHNFKDNRASETPQGNRLCVGVCWRVFFSQERGLQKHPNTIGFVLGCVGRYFFTIKRASETPQRNRLCVAVVVVAVFFESELLSK